MRKTLLALGLSSVAILAFTGRAEQLVADATTNFEPARPAGAAEQPNAPAPAASPEAQQAAQEEVLRRQAAQIAGRALLDEGQKLYYDGKYDQAIAKLQQALQTIPRAKATQVEYTRAVQALTDSYYKLGNAAFRAGENARARDYALKALEVDPKNRNAEILLVNVRKVEVAGKSAVKPEGEQARPDQTPEFKAKQDEVRRLFREGKILMNSGQYDGAENRFQQILLLDPYNDDAYQLIDQVTQLRQPSTIEGSQATRNRMIWQADNAWVAPISGEVRQPKIEGGADALTARSTASASILRKLNEIIFPEIKFRDATITDVVGFLSDESRRLDPTHEGVNIVLGAGATGEATAAAPTEAAPAPSGGPRPITLSLRNVPMIEALKYITSLANLKYRVESSAVLILSADAPEGAMISRSYPVTPGAFSKLITAPSTSSGGATGDREYVRIGETSGAVSSGSVDVKQLFTDAGVPFPAGSSILYNQSTSVLIVKNTPDNIEVLERLLPSFIEIPKQVEIEAKFVEISQNDLDELGFHWKVGQRRFGGNTGTFGSEGGSPSTVFETGSSNPDNSDSISGGLRDTTAIQGNAIEAVLAGSTLGALLQPNNTATIKGILTNPQFELVINALSQKKSTDLLSAPKVTTISGVQAQIKVVQEFIYPTEFSEPQVASQNAGIVATTTGQTQVTLPNITPSIPSSFKTREVGVVLNVTPTVGADGYTINLTLIPEVSEFVGFLDYSPGDIISGTARIGFKIQQPLFSSRNLTTSIVVWDGQTVVLGGLIREEIQKVDDKIPLLGDIPVLGRLFRSKVSNRTKRNLLIFVTARLIDPAGNPIHKENMRASSR